MAAEDEIAAWLCNMRRYRGLRDQRNKEKIPAAPAVLRAIVGAPDIDEEFLGGLENILALFICDENRQPGPPRDRMRLLVAAALNFWPTGVPADLLEICRGRAQLDESNWSARASWLSQSELITLSDRPDAYNGDSLKAFLAFAEYALKKRPPAGRDYFLPRTRRLRLGDTRTIEVHEVAVVSGTPAISWHDFGCGIQRLTEQIAAHELDIDLVVGVNEAGLAMGAMLTPVWRGRPALGLLRTRGVGKGSHEIVERASMLPAAADDADAVLLCDFEAKSGNAPVVAVTYVRAHAPRVQRIYLAVMGALVGPDMVLGVGNELLGVEDLACQPHIVQAGLDDIFVGAVMAGSIDPPTRSR